MWPEFKQFILRGNVVDLGIGVVIGAAFGAVVNALVKDLFTPLISALIKLPDFSGWNFSVNGGKFMIGDFLNAFLSFLIIGTALYFIVVLPVNALMAKNRRVSPDPITKKCPECLSEIPLAAKRCAYCTAPIT